jgi:hypothetical protein
MKGKCPAVRGLPAYLDGDRDRGSLDARENALKHDSYRESPVYCIGQWEYRSLKGLMSINFSAHHQHFSLQIFPKFLLFPDS